MRLYLVQSLDSGAFLVPVDGYVGWCLSLRRALACALVPADVAAELVQEHGDVDTEIVYVRDSADSVEEGA